MKFTVLGATGFIGSHLSSYLRQQGHECYTPARDDASIYTQALGHVVYCIGLTADFRTRPFDTVRAHVSVLADVLERAQFDSFLYLSSTRVYGGLSTTNEDAVMQVDSQNPSDLYNLSKLMGESLCMGCGKANVRVARLSNVYGNDVESENFLTSIIRDAVLNKHVTLRTTLDSSKDYVDIEDVVEILPKIAAIGQGKVYNVACGVNVSNEFLMKELAGLTACSFDVADNAVAISLSPVDVSKPKAEFNFRPKQLGDQLAKLVDIHYLNARAPK